MVASISFSEFTCHLFERLVHFTRGKNWRVRAVLVCFGCVFIFQFPEYQYLYKYAVSNSELNPVYENLLKQIANPWVNHCTNPILHEAKMVFRLTIPLLAGILHLNIFSLLLLQLVMGLVMFWALLTLIDRITQDRAVALLLGLAACFTYYGGAFLHDIYCFFDTFSYSLLVLMLLSRRASVIYALSVVGCFLDERFLIASLLVVFWHAMRAPQDFVPSLQRLAITRASMATVTGWLTYWGIRLWLGATYGLKTYGGAVGLDALRANLYNERTALGFVTGLESFWILVALAVIVLAKQRQWKVLLLLLLAFSPILAGSFLVWDITRSLAFGFPIVLLSLVVLQYCFARESLRQLALMVLVFAVLTPNYYYQFATFYSESIFEKMGRYVLLHT